MSVRDAISFRNPKNANYIIYKIKIKLHLARANNFRYFVLNPRSQKSNG